MGIPMLKIRRSQDRLIFNIGIPILVRQHLYIEIPPKPQQGGYHVADIIVKWNFLNENYGILIKFHFSLSPKVPLIISNYCFRLWLGDKQATSHYLVLLDDNPVHWCIHALPGLNQFSFSLGINELTAKMNAAINQVISRWCISHIQN